MITILAFIYTFFISGVFLFIMDKTRILYIDRVAIKLHGLGVVVMLYFVSSEVSYSDFCPLATLSLLLCYLLQINRVQRANFGRKYLIFYLLFFVWNILLFLRLNEIHYGINMLLKLFLPIPIFCFTYYSIVDKDSIWLVLEKMARSIKFFPLVAVASYFFGETVPINVYYGMMIFPIIFILYLRNKDRKYLLFCALCFSFAIIDFKRTPMIGIALSLILMCFYKYKLKAVIPAMSIIMLSICAILFITPIRERFFFEGFDVNAVNWSFVFSGDFMAYVNTNGRNSMWGEILDTVYKGNEWFGVGPGALKSWIVSPETNMYSDSFQRVHNDWLQILCESGRIGVSLLIFMFCGLFRYTFRIYNNLRLSKSLRLIALGCAMCSIETIIHMFFENCLGVASYAMPAFFSALLFRCVEFEKIT